MHRHSTYVRAANKSWPAARYLERASMVDCRECGYECARSDFSSRQLYAGGNQTCKDCTSERQPRSRSPTGRGRTRSRPRPQRRRSRSRSRDYSDGDSDGDSEDSDGGSVDDDGSTDISDVWYDGPNLEGFLANHGWDMSDDRGDQGVYYRNDDECATLTIWWQTGKYFRSRGTGTLGRSRAEIRQVCARGSTFLQSGAAVAAVRAPLPASSPRP